MSTASRNRVRELLVSRATQGLDAKERGELRSLLRAHPEWDDESFDLAAAALDLALQGEPPDVPAPLKERLLSQGRRWLPPATGAR